MWHSIVIPSVIVTLSVKPKSETITLLWHSFQPWPKAAHRSARVGVHKMQSWGHWHQGDQYHCSQDSNREHWCCVFSFKLYRFRCTWRCTARRRLFLAQSVELALDTRTPWCDTGDAAFNIYTSVITIYDPSRWQHQESRPQKCPLCTRQFVAASRLKSHLRAAHTQVSSSRSQTMLIHLK